MFEKRKRREQKTVQKHIEDGTVKKQSNYVLERLLEVQTREEGEAVVREILKYTEKTSRTAYREMEEEAYALLDEHFPQKSQLSLLRMLMNLNPSRRRRRSVRWGILLSYV